MTSMSLRLSCLVPLAITIAACHADQPAAAEAGRTPSLATDAEPEPAPQPAEATTPALVLTPQPGWIVEKPANTMRKAQYSLPRADGDSEDASLIVHYFGGQGGSREDNLRRWAGQFEQPDGSSSADKLKSSERTIAGLAV